MSPALRCALGVLVTAATLSGCAEKRGDAPSPVSVSAPERGACRLLTPEDVAQESNETEPLDCAEEHTAETYAVGVLPATFADAGHDDRGVNAFAFERCSKGFKDFLGADDSLAMRTVLSWAWFRPTEEAWEQGARWYRCDVVGGGEQSKDYVALPETAAGLLLGRPDDRWLVCADGDTVAGSVKVPCTEPHTWRAVTTIVLGKPEDSYPGDRVSEVRSRDYCSESVGAWLNYPATYEYGFTWFREAEWESGNRRAVCWAKTSQ